jgi:SAM-dependent methyltransferase
MPAPKPEPVDCAPFAAPSGHWDSVHLGVTPDKASWFQRFAGTSLALVRRAGIEPSHSVVDVGAGTSAFAEGLVGEGYQNVTLLDVSHAALRAARRRLGAQAHYIVEDVTCWRPDRQFALWHDRAMFHFLVDEAARAQYRRALSFALHPGGKAIIATFDLSGPSRCSGLPVRRYSPGMLAAELSDVLRPIEAREEVHVTPSGVEQPFIYGLFEKVLPPRASYLRSK